MQITGFQPNTPLPGFRKDLKIFKGPQDDDGAPTYNLYDPVKGQYYKLSWSERTILVLFRPGMTLEDLLAVIRKQTTIQASQEDLNDFFQQAQQNSLLQSPVPSDYLNKLSSRIEGGWMWWLLTHYLYLRIPIFKPQKFLISTVKYVKVLVSTPFLIFYLLVIVSGLTIIVNRWEEYIRTILHFFSFEGAFWYAVAISFIKVIHELAHAYTATAYGVRVPSIGVAFIVLWPVLYTDVTHSWRLSSRWQRFLISAAGVLAELTLAGLATLGWALSPPGIFQSVCYVISTTSLATTLIVNLNPAMRFDGYYLLSDLWGIDNLQDRSYKVARWKMHQLFLGIDAPPPEEGLSKRTVAGLTIFAIYTWIYRISLYTAIAVFVYFAFTKSLGVILFISEVLIFLVWPFFLEVKEIIRVKKYYTKPKRLYLTLGILTLLLLWFVVPLPRTYTYPAFTAPEMWQVVYVPEDSKIKKIFVNRGDKVKKGDRLILLESETLQAGLDTARIEENIQKSLLKKAEIMAQLRPTIPAQQAILEQYSEKRRQLEHQMEKLDIKAEIDGLVYAWDKNLIEGEYVSKGREIGKIADLNTLKVYVFVPENKTYSVVLDRKAEFYIPSYNKSFKGKISNMQPFRALNFSYLPLASHFGGTIPTIEKNNQMEVIESYYIIEIELLGENLPKIGQTGYARWIGPSRSYALDLINYVQRVLLRESGF